MLAAADVKGSTATMLHYAQDHPEVKEFIVATEAGILHEMQRTCHNLVRQEKAGPSYGVEPVSYTHLNNNTTFALWITLWKSREITFS